MASIPSVGSGGSESKSAVFARIASQLKGCTQPKPGQWQALCPAHEDTEASFGFCMDGDGRILLNCFRGCSKESILAAIGLTFRDLAPDGPARPRLDDPDRKSDRTPPDEWERRCAKWSAFLAKSSAARSGLAQALSIPEATLTQFPDLGCWDDRTGGPAWTFPERDATGRIVGVGLRTRDHKKSSAGGSARGLSIPAGWKERPGPLFLVEGPSDVLAMTAAGLAAVGRPSNVGGVKFVAELVRAQVPADRRVIWMGENDPKPDGSWPGRDESKKAAAKLAAQVGRAVEFALPPGPMDKDVRSWLTNLVLDGCQWEEVGDRFTTRLVTCVIDPGTKGAAVEAPPPAGKVRPPILLGGNQMDVNDEVLKHLPNDENLYARGNILVRAIQTPGKIIYRGKDQKTGEPIPVMVIPAQSRLAEVPLATLREKISNAVDLCRLTTRGETKSADVPDWCVTAIHAREEWPTLKTLTALVDYPVLRPDGTIFATRGHDPVTGVFYNHTGTVTIPENPTREDARAAWELLEQVICDFPFENREVHSAAWLAALLTPMTRFAFNGCVPVFLIDGNVAGAGKGLLADTISLILTGRPFATMGYTDDNTEMSKRITAIAIEGEQLIMFDNISHGFGGSAIDRALTSLEWSERILGQSRNIKCPLRVGWYGTGNNIEFVGDILRRLCQIRLESTHDRPEERKGFVHGDLRAWLMLNRDALLSAAATILAAYYAAGAPQTELKSWGSFEAWSGVVRQAIAWLDLKDPMSTRDQATESDVTRSAIRTIIWEWHKLDGHAEGLTTNKIIAALFPRHEWQPDQTPVDRARLTAEAKLAEVKLAELADAVTQLNPRPNGRALGQHFRKYREMRFDGLYLTQCEGKDRTGVARWKVMDSKTGKPVANDWKPPESKKDAKEEGAGNAGCAGSGANPPNTETINENPLIDFYHSPTGSNPAYPAHPASKPSPDSEPKANESEWTWPNDSED